MQLQNSELRISVTREIANSEKRENSLTQTRKHKPFGIRTKAFRRLQKHQILTLNNLRHNVTLRTDGGLKTGRDIVMAAMMGAEEYGMGTSSLVAMGCIMVRQCHSNTCPVGVCSQDASLREKFTGTPEKVVNLFKFVAKLFISLTYQPVTNVNDLWNYN